jgi:PAS domain S-box-containing protein
MAQPLRVLHLEDNRNYSALVASKLAAEGFDPDVLCVETEAEFDAALNKGGFDIIIADFHLPTYDGIKALKLAREKQPNVPVLLVSGTIGEEAAIESLKAGATDYVLKHWTERLVPSVRRALREAEERKHRLAAETELTRREKRFLALSENSLDVVTILNSEALFMYNSPSVTRMLGYEPDELTGKNAFAFIHEEDVPKTMEDFKRTAANPELTTISKFRVRHKDGGWRYLETICKSFLGDPEIGGVVVNSREVTERHRIERYNEMLSALGHKLSSVVTAEEAARIIIEAADDLFGWDSCILNLYSPDDDMIFPVLSVDTMHGERFDVPKTDIDPHPTTRTRRIINQGPELILRREPVTFEAEGAAMGDKTHPSASLMFVPVKKGTRIIGILSIQSYKINAYDQKDLAGLQTLGDYCGGALERIRVEQALRQSERRFRQLFEDSPDAVFVEDFDGSVLDANLAAARLQGTPREKLLGKKVADLVPKEKRTETLQIFKKLVSGELNQAEGVSLTSDGRQIPVEVRTSRIDYSGSPALLLHVRDISERKHAEEALKGSEVRFHSVWENSVDGMRLTDENGIIVAVNEAFCKLVGMKREELEGQPFTVSYAEGEDLEKKLQAYRQRFKDRTVERRIERRLTFRTGKTVELEGANSFVESRGQRTLLLGLFRDITDHKRLEDQLRHSQKMDAIGQLAGGVAHDFNNILTVIQGHAALLRSAGVTGPVAGSAEQIAQAAERAAGLTRQLLTFSRRQMMQPKQLDLNAVVSNTTKMLGRILGEDIELQFNYSPNLPLVHADVGMMEQVLLNLAVNSRDAMPEGGQLSIRISVVDLAKDDPKEHPEGRPGKFVCLSVSDTGSGIKPEVLPHIFEPFFTTKAVGKGTGLGLATVYGIIKQHQGWIEVESRMEQGTTFNVFLPGGGDAAAKPKGDTSVEEAARGGNETILVVEDEPPVRDLVSRVLKSAGYNVLQATSGTHALEVWGANKDKIDLLLTDIVMPDGMTGRDLAEAVQAEKPALKAIFTSGYSADIVGKDFIIEDGVNFLQKPYVPQKLIRVVRKCLDGR